MGTIRYLLSEGARGFFQAKLVTYVSIVTIAVVLFGASAVTVAMINVWVLLQKAVERADFVVYLSDEAAADSTALAAIVGTVRSFPQVSGVSYTDRTAARERFAALYGRDMLDAVDENPLPASLEITLAKQYQSTEAAASLEKKMEAVSGVEAVRYGRDWLDLLARFRRWFLCAAVALAAAMIVTLHITISNSIKLTIYARKELVRSMHLVGATRFFISMPFIIEGMIQGLAGGVTGMGFFYLCKAVFTIEPSLRNMPIAWGPPALPFLFLLLGVLFGWFGSVFSVRKFLI